MRKKEKEFEEKGIQSIRWKVILGKPGTIAGLAIIAAFFVISALAPLIAPHDPLYVDVAQKLQPPSAAYWLGTDSLGRCIASRMIWGGRTTLSYSIVVLFFTLLIGIPVGLVSGYLGGKADMIIMRIVDIFMAMPSLVMVLAIAGTLGCSGRNMVIAMACVCWASYARLTRALTMQAKQQGYIIALKAGGCSGPRILFKHILKNISPAIIALASVEFGAIILSIAGYSFLGLGVQAPMPEWGVMLSDSKAYIQTYPQFMIYPGIAIVAIVLAFNLVGNNIQKGMAGR